MSELLIEPNLLSGSREVGHPIGRRAKEPPKLDRVEKSSPEYFIRLSFAVLDRRDKDRFTGTRPAVEPKAEPVPADPTVSCSLTRERPVTRDFVKSSSLAFVVFYLERAEKAFVKVIRLRTEMPFVSTHSEI